MSEKLAVGSKRCSTCEHKGLRVFDGYGHKPEPPYNRPTKNKVPREARLLECHRPIQSFDWLKYAA